MTDAKQPRPLVVTFACVFAGIMSFQVLITLWAALANWGSLELQEWLRPALESPALRDQDIGMEDALSALRLVAFVIVVASIAGVVFSVFAARGDRASRVSLTVLCVLGAVVYTGLGAGGILPAVALLACAFVLWSPEARVWFALKNGRTPPPAVVARVQQRREAVTGAGLHPGARPRGEAAPPPPAPAQAPHPYGHHVPTPPAPTPGLVVRAGIITLISSLVSGLMTASTAVAHLSRLIDPRLHEERFGDQPLPAEAMFGVAASTTVDVWAAVIASALTALAGVGFLAGVGLIAGLRWCRALTVGLGFATIVLAAAAIPWGLPVVVAAIAVVWMLRRPEARAWSNSR